MAEENDWSLYGWVMRGRQRREVIAALNRPKTATQIKKETQISVTHVASILKCFVERGIAVCLTPELTTGKVYELTEKGKRIRRELLRED